MELRRLGTSDLQVSVVGLGCNNLGGRIDDEASRKVVNKALDLGITLFDTADNYGNRGGSERALGQILGARRKEIVLASKFGMEMDDAGEMQGASRRYIMSAVEASLQRLKTDWLDLYQIHKPDPTTPIEETLRALDDLVRQGKVRFIGCSNFSAAQVNEAISASSKLGVSALVSCQDHYSLITRDLEQERIPAMRAHQMSLLPFYPLESGLLTGKYQRNAPLPPGSRMARGALFVDRFLTDRNWNLAEKLIAFAQQRGRAPIELAMSWVATQSPVASVIAGATKPEQVEQNVNAVGWSLSAEDLREIDRISAPGRT